MSQKHPPVAVYRPCPQDAEHKQTLPEQTLTAWEENPAFVRHVKKTRHMRKLKLSF